MNGQFSALTVAAINNHDKNILSILQKDSKIEV
jgi:hypothetical protein